MNSSAPHLSSLTVGEWSPKGLGGRLPPVRETDRLKPRQQKMLVTTLAVPQRRAKEPLCLLELIPGGGGGSRRQRGGLKYVKSTERGLGWSRESFPLR